MAEPPEEDRSLAELARRLEDAMRGKAPTRVTGSSLPPPTPANITSPPNPQPPEKLSVEGAIQQLRSMQESGTLDRMRRGFNKDNTLRSDIAEAVEQSERSEEKTTVSEGSWTPDDWAVAAVSALIAIPLCEAGWHAVVNEPEHFARGLTAILVGVPLGLAGFSFHRWKTKISAKARDAIGLASLRWWPISLFLAFAYFAVPVAYQRATAPLTPPAVVGFTQQQVDAKIAAVVANLNSQLAEANRQRDAARREADVFRQKIQNAPPQLPAPEDQIPVNWQPDFQLNWYAGPKIAWIRFIGVSAALAHIKDAYIISTLTGHKEQLDVANATNFTERWKIDQVEPIPSGAQVILVYELKPPPSLADFMSQWGAFEFHVVYDNKEYVKIYSQDYINSKMTREMPGVFGPRVTPRNDK
jgi:hypothetical protein